MTPHDVSSHSLYVVSHNVQGMNSTLKRRTFFQHYHSQKANVVLLQETHFPRQYNPAFIHQKFPQFLDKTRVVGIFLSKQTSFSLSRKVKDREGRYLFLLGMIDGSHYTFVFYYAPIQGQASFFDSLLRTLSPDLVGMVILGGDSNIALDQLLDKSKVGRSPLLRPPKQSFRIVKILHSHSLVDVWRQFNPSSGDYTHLSTAHQTHPKPIPNLHPKFLL